MNERAQVTLNAAQMAEVQKHIKGMVEAMQLRKWSVEAAVEIYKSQTDSRSNIVELAQGIYDFVTGTADELTAGKH